MKCLHRPPRPLPAVIVLAAVLSAGPLRGDAKPLRQVIDSEVQAARARQKVTPAPPGTDAEFLRRVCLDLVGVTPTYEETVAFLGGADRGKREKLVDRLLAAPRFARHQADVWDLV